MFQAAGGMDLLYVRIEDHHHFRGHQVFTIPMKEFWFLFNMDALALTSHSSVARFCKCLFYYQLKINAIGTLSHI
jgi:hypothetical protein